MAEIQWLLIQLGYSPGPVDGKLGPLTEAAIAAFEEDHGLPRTRQPSKDFLARLRDLATIVPGQKRSGQKTPRLQTQAAACDAVAEDLDWEPQEKWAWKQFCIGEVADFREGADGVKDFFSEAFGFVRYRGHRITSKFLLDIVTLADLRDKLPVSGIQIRGAWFPDPIVLEDLDLPFSLRLRNSVFDRPTNLSKLRTSYTVNLSGSEFNDELKLSFAAIGEDLFLQNGIFHSLNLGVAEIGGMIWMPDVTIEANLNLNSAVVDGYVSMKDSRLNASQKCERVVKCENNLRNMRVGRDLDMSRIVAHSTLLSEGIVVGGNVRLEKSKLSATHFDGARIDGSFIAREARIGRGLTMLGALVDRQIILAGAAATGPLDFRRVTVNQSIELRYFTGLDTVWFDGAKLASCFCAQNSTFQKTLSLTGVDARADVDFSGSAFNGKVAIVNSSVNGYLVLSSSTFRVMDLTGTGITRALRLGVSPNADHHVGIGGRRGERLILSKAKSTSLEEYQTAAWSPWPSSLVLDGFVFSRWDRLAYSEDNDLRLSEASGQILRKRASEDWFINQWLDDQPAHSSQPFRQISEYLRGEGLQSDADEVMIHYHDKVLSEADSFSEYISLWTQKLLVGYGYRPHQVLYWIAVSSLLGVIIRYVNECTSHRTFQMLVRSKSYRKLLLAEFPSHLWWSLDTLLPAIELDPTHKEQPPKLKWGARTYFGLHRAFGYVLAFFLAAAITGLLK